MAPLLGEEGPERFMGNYPNDLRTLEGKRDFIRRRITFMVIKIKQIKDILL